MAVVNLFNAAALDIFFEDDGNMGLSNRTCLQLTHEGITHPEDFKEFDEDGLSAIFLNLYKPPKSLCQALRRLLRGGYERFRRTRCPPIRKCVS
jgi:hypothetical protein